MGHVLKRALVAAAVLLAAACNGKSTPMDMSVQPDLYSRCGHPGDKGNSLGVGQYCTGFGDCTGMAGICAIIGDSTLFFCTMTCTMGDDAGNPPTNCGENASCVCGSSGKSSGCACYPNSCK